MDNYQNEDWMLDESFQVETGFIDSLESEQEINIARKYLKPCSNCGEWVSKENICDDICNICNMSENHSERRSMSSEASDNYRSLEQLVRTLEGFE